MMPCVVGLLALAGDLDGRGGADAAQGGLERPRVVRVRARRGAGRAHHQDGRLLLERDLEGQQPFAARELAVEQPQQAALLRELRGDHLAVALRGGSRRSPSSAAASRSASLVHGQADLAPEVDEGRGARLAWE